MPWAIPVSAPLAILLLCSTAALGQPTPPSAVKGTLRDSVTKVGISGGEAYLFGGALKEPRKTLTSATGNYRFDGLARGSYGIRFSKDGFNEPDDREPTFPVGADDVVRDGELSPWSKLSGRVFDPEGKPAAGIPITLVPGPIYGGTVDGEDPVTDEEGRFEFGRLMAGDYHLLANLRPLKRDAPPQPKAPVDSDGIRTEWVRTYFPGASTFAQAQSINVASGANLSLPNFKVQALPVYRVTGVVLTEDGQPASEVDVGLSNGFHRYGITIGNKDRSFLRPGDGFQPDDYERTLTAADGTFHFDGVAEGDWELVAERRGDGRSGDEARSERRASIRLNLARRDIQGLELRLASPFSLPVTADWGGNAPSADARNSGLLVLEALDTKPAPGIEIPINAPKMLIGLFPGRFRLFAVTSVPGYYVDSIEAGGRDVTDQPVTLTAGLPGIRLKLKSGAARITGKVEPPSEANQGKVVLWSESTFGDPGMMRSVTPDTAGAFEIEGLRPGSYKVAWTKNTSGPGGLTLAAVARLSANAASVSLSQGSTAPVRLSRR